MESTKRLCKERLESVLMIRKVSIKDAERECCGNAWSFKIIADHNWEAPLIVINKLSRLLDCPVGYLTKESDDWDISKVTLPDPIPVQRKKRGPNMNVRNGRKIINFDLLRLKTRIIEEGYSNANIGKFCSNNPKLIDSIMRENIKSLPIEELNALLYYLHCDLDYLEGKTNEINPDNIPSLRDLKIYGDWVCVENVVPRLTKSDTRELAEHIKVSYNVLTRINYSPSYFPLSIARAIKRYLRNKGIDININEQNTDKLHESSQNNNDDANLYTDSESINNIEIPNDILSSTTSENGYEVLESADPNVHISAELIKGTEVVQIQDDNKELNRDNLITYLKTLSIKQIDVVKDICDVVKSIKESEQLIEEFSKEL